MANNVLKTRKEEEQKCVVVLIIPEGGKYVITGNKNSLSDLKSKFANNNIREVDLSGFVVRKEKGNRLIECSDEDKKRLVSYGNQVFISDIRSLDDIYKKSPLLQVLREVAKQAMKKEK
ncbi:MAG: hypothetical protein QW153_03705 [Candidatus Bilamarchaeaceae archaeon]